MKVVMKEFTESLLNDEELRSSVLKAAAEVTSVVAEDTSVADNIKKITGNLCRSVYKDGVETAQYYIPFVPKRDTSYALVVENGIIAAKNA
ncbi:hypothetical protein SARC_05542 [Sphaeroforma arctica JP610]|uniref:Uncharacterized protein n=1 Tax=Sphaeroforma arctica JP610 TaxID=667725 RepID=A0A0L0G014_9EUKA|nr:hypothetical protein SARC_05542 [Sphaeroforma arctica JP610]KNC82161.1 hypothetical protein SARC_05542 [Sphaeroforma arctica JP610]|eukprot:XP_014156063.1 hypothetical protein SARC_05542 [Sphaeroforma arctica JP610]